MQTTRDNRNELRFPLATFLAVSGLLAWAVIAAAQGSAAPGNTLPGTRPTSSKPTDTDQEKAGDADRGQSSGAPAGELQLEMLRVHDPMINNVEALRILVPRGWTMRGGIEWRPNASNLAVARMSVSDPTGMMAINYFPCDALCWSNSLAGYGFGTGSNYLGNEVCPPINRIALYVARVVLPRYRGAGFDARLVGEVNLPDVAATVADSIAEPGVQKQVIAGRVRIAYQRDGIEIEEDIYCTLAFATTPANPGFVLWGPERLYSFAAAKGELDRLSPLFQASASSMTIDLNWYNKYRQVWQLWEQRMHQSIRDAGMLSRYIARVNDEITAINREAYENYQRTMDRVNRRFSNYIRGVEEYRSHYSQSTVQLPAYYSHVWESDSGAYFLSNSPNFDPNRNSTHHWVRIDPAG